MSKISWEKGVQWTCGSGSESTQINDWNRGHSSFIHRLQNRLEGGGERGERCHHPDLLCLLTVIWSGAPLTPWWRPTTGPLSLFKISLIGGIQIGARALLNNNCSLAISPAYPCGEKGVFYLFKWFLPAFAAPVGTGGGDGRGGTLSPLFIASLWSDRY